MRFWLFACAALLAVPAAQAAINQPQGFVEHFPYLPNLESDVLTFASGELDADLGDVEGPFGFFHAAGARVEGLTVVCWQDPGDRCVQSASGGLSLVVSAGSFALRFPTSVAGNYRAGHAVGLFVDYAGKQDLNTLPMGRSLLAPSVGGRMEFGDLPSIPNVIAAGPSGSGNAVGIDVAARIEIRDAANLVATVSGKSKPILFSGEPEIPVFDTDFAVLPFEAGSRSQWTRATRADAVEGLNAQRLQDKIVLFDQSHAKPVPGRARFFEGALRPYQGSFVTIANGAVLQSGSDNAPPEDRKGIYFVRFTKMDVSGAAQDTLDWRGRATLEVDNGHLQNAPSLAGFWFIQMPWWSWVLWVIGLGVWVTRMVRHPVKTNAKWDRLRWIGWTATGVMLILLVILWDLEVRAVFGVSTFSGGLSAELLALVALMEFGTLSLVLGAIAAPLRLIARNTFWLTGQGTFMGLAGPVALLLTFLLGAFYLRSYIDLFLSQVIVTVG